MAGLGLIAIVHITWAQQRTRADGTNTVQQFINELHSNDRNERRRATTTLRQIGPKDKEGVPLLLAALKENDKFARSRLIAALVRIGPATVPHLVQSVKHSDTLNVRLGAINALGSIHAAPKTSIPTLVGALSDEAPEVRRASIFAIGQFGKLPVEIIHDLTAVATGDSDSKVRAAAVSLLGHLHLLPATSVPCLIRALTDHNADVRRASVVAIREFGKDAEPAAASLARAVNDTDSLVRSRAFKTIAMLGETARETIPTLLKAMLDEDSQKSRLSSAALRHVGPLSQTAVDAILEATEDSSPHVRRNAVWVLGSIGDLSQRAMPKLLELLDDDDETIQRATLLTLGELGIDASESTSRLVVATKSKDRIMSALAEQTLRRVAPKRASELFGEPFDAVQARLDDIRNFRVRKHDSPQLGGSRFRNNTPPGANIPTKWNVGKFDRRTGEWNSSGASNIKWVAKLGSQTYGNTVVANGKVYVGTNNAAGYLKRYPSTTDVGCLLCFRESDGKFLWQHSSEKLSTGRVHDWPLQGICSSPVIEGDRLWFVTSRGEVRCLDTNGFFDGEDDGPVRNEEGTLFDVRRRDDNAEPDDFKEAVTALQDTRLSPFLRQQFTRVGMELPELATIEIIEPNQRWRLNAKIGSSNRQFEFNVRGPRLRVSKQITVDDRDEADVIWKFDMMKELGVSQHNMATCGPTIWGDTLFICTSNGVDESHVNIPAPDAPSFMAMDKNTGEVLWTDNSPGKNILHGQWSCPVVGVFGGAPQVIFAGGDGWLYSFRADRWKDGKPELVWKFDGNPKESKWILGGRGTRNNIIAVPVIYDGLVYIAMGQDPEHGEDIGRLWCIDPTKRGDVSPELVVDANGESVPHRRIQAALTWERICQSNLKVGDGLDKGIVSQPLRKELQRAGVELPKECSVKTDVAGSRWIVTARINGMEVQFRVIAKSRRIRDTELHSLSVERKTRETVKPNPNSAVVWQYDNFDQDGDGEIDFEEEFHRTIGSPVIKNDLLMISDFSGLFHCVNAKTGVPFWTCDLLAACWATPLIVENKVYVCDEDGDVALFELSADPSRFTEASTDLEWDGLFPLHEINMGNSVYSTPIVANNVLYIANKTHLFAIEAKRE